MSSLQQTAAGSRGSHVQQLHGFGIAETFQETLRGLSGCDILFLGQRLRGDSGPYS
jgi:hypothetical protein